MTTIQTLLDLGEREILRAIIPRFVTAAGDDCAIIPLPGGSLVATTDPVPPPAAVSIGGDSDPFWMGWLLVTINASDLAASGASPLAFLAALECEGSKSVSDFERLLEGIRSACDEAGLKYVGGNIRESKAVSGVGIALGWCEDYSPLRRIGAKANEIIVSVGKGGVFWRDALRALAGQPIEKNQSPLFRPKSQIGIMPALAKAGLVSAAMDNSDGLLPTLSELSAKNQLSIELTASSLTVDGVAPDDPVGSARMWLGWGDWNVIASIAADKVATAQAMAETQGYTVTPIGRFLDTPGPVYLRRDREKVIAPRLESERFSRDSWMLTGIQSYVDLLKRVELP